MRSAVFSFFSSVLRLGLGEAIARLCSFIFLAYLSRHYSLEVFGAVTLAQGIANYVTLGTDQGLRMIGARLASTYPEAIHVLIPNVIRKRLLSCFVCVSLATAYAWFGPVPQSSRFYILGFSVAVFAYACSLDWLVWGLGKMGWLGAWRAGISLCFLICALLTLPFTTLTSVAIVGANAISAVAGGLVLWLYWSRRRRDCFEEVETDAIHAITKRLSWAAVLPLGISTILNQAFHNVDSILLAAMTPIEEVGRYNAAYKILFLILGLYYLLTQSAYPRLANSRAKMLPRRLLLTALAVAIGVGGVVAAAVGVFADRLLIFVYGSDLGAGTLLRVLCVAIPMDFAAALMGIALVSQSKDKPVLWAALIAAGSNILLNLLLIPHLRGLGSAIATLVSYLVLLSILFPSLLRSYSTNTTDEIVLSREGALS